MSKRLAFTASILATFTLGAAPTPPATDGARLLEEFRAICLDFDGAMDIAEEVALERGYRHAPDEVQEDLFQRGGLYVYSRDVDGTHWRLVMKKARYFLGASETEASTTRFIQCAVSADPGDFSSARRAVARHTGLRSFAQRNTTVFAWTPGEDDERHQVPAVSFERRGIELFNEEGMRAIMVARHGNQVIMTLMTPQEPVA
ncbi:MAG: hypothetical protein EON86_06965 [Brevundimonas sp.]|nr:MAG: hypothetical protein EON86_06965 [Brevundimonas sp.]